MRSYKIIIVLTLLAFAGISSTAYASQSSGTFMICPSVSLNNQNGMWVIGTHGAYYVHMVIDPNTGSPVMANVPVTVASQAQIPAGWSLYKDYPSYPNFAGDAKILSEGIATWLGGASGFSEGDRVHVTINTNGTTTILDLNTGTAVTVQGYIPLASAVFW